MKRSEFIERLSREAAPAVWGVALAEEAGVQWDPEEPEGEGLRNGDILTHDGEEFVIHRREAAKRLVADANRLPALEALAQELAASLDTYHDAFSKPCNEHFCGVAHLLDHARALGLLP